MPALFRRTSLPARTRTPADNKGQPVKTMVPTLLALLAGPAAAQGIALFGDARLGLGYNIDNDGGVLVEDGTPPTTSAPSRASASAST